MTSAEIANWVSGIGSLGAVVTALFGFRLIERQRQADRKIADETVAYELVSAIHNIGNHLQSIQQHCLEQRNDIKIRANEFEESYKVFNPLIGLSDEGTMALPSGSTFLLIKAKQVDLWNDLQLLVARNKSLTALMIEYRTLWERMIEKTPVPFDFTGTIGQIESGPEGYLALRPILVMIDKATGDISSQANDTMALVDRVIPRLGPAFSSFFETPFMGIRNAEEPKKQASEVSL